MPRARSAPIQSQYSSSLPISGIEPGRIGDVVAVGAAGYGLQVRRGVTIWKSERREVIDDCAGIANRKLALNCRR